MRNQRGTVARRLASCCLNMGIYRRVSFPITSAALGGRRDVMAVRIPRALQEITPERQNLSFNGDALPAFCGGGRAGPLTVTGPGMSQRALQPAGCRHDSGIAPFRSPPISRCAGCQPLQRAVGVSHDDVILGAAARRRHGRAPCFQWAIEPLDGSDAIRDRRSLEHARHLHVGRPPLRIRLTVRVRLGRRFEAFQGALRSLTAR